MDRSIEELEQLATLFDSFGQTTRLAILLGFYEGETAPSIADHVGISRPGLQNHLQKMRNAGLIRKTESGSYALTPVGTYFAELVKEREDELQNAVNTLEDAESEAEQALSEQVNPEMVSDTEWQRIVEEKKWELTAGRIDELLKQK